MMKIAYLECQTGIAGDMCLGALVDAGVPLEYLQKKLDRLGITSEYELESERVERHGQVATKIHVKLAGIHTESEHHHHHDRDNGEHHHHHHDRTESEHHHHYDRPQRHFPEIKDLIIGANLSEKVTQSSIDTFWQLALAEGAVHGIDPNEVHFHEVGAVDAIVDIVGTCIGLDYLGIDRLYCSPLPTGGGTVRAAHGILPVPVPAVLKLWESRSVPIYHNGIDRELVTPTGAAIAVTLSAEFGPPPAMKLTKIGLGAGSLKLKIPNMVRLWLGTIDDRAILADRESITVLETQIDDLNPQAIGYIFDRLLNAGALDVFTQSIGMKKSRPGILLTVICSPELQSDCEEIIFTETTTLGIRASHQNRSILAREIQSIDTKYGKVKLKIARSNHGERSEIINVQPEYEDCAALAIAHRVSWLSVHRAAIVAWESK
jgi:pyridinium-3,5-bisthiocarboxylic acid mononucleotide nickel chelatase